ncbi:hypothetical protein M413DRAFT_447958 [Hebeloma cylindrosporum]|uniref:Uncharacterized protein n=1 Tax=Hebeloma cylindrosporum TaxID=76867 RepID=A0A0C3C3R3_HEBCY|nr:hypothetical protein M413DRAFT_447958 [Hebeloma cylindrosporum h7]
MGAPSLCSRCSGKVLRPERCNFSDGKPCAPCTEDMELEKEEKKLETMIEEIQIKRRALRTRMNDNHDRLIHRFPPEIASHVFIQYSPPSEFCDRSDGINPLLLGAVCQKWRRLAWATPRLWTSLLIRKSNDDRLPLFTEWLERSATLPLTVTVVDGPERGYPKEEVINILNKHSARWHDMHFVLPPHLLSRLSGSSQENILLRLALSQTSTVSDFFFPKFSMKSKPKPRDLALTRIGLPSVDILWNNLTLASLASIGVDHCFELMRRAPSLESLCLRAITHSSNVFPTPHSRIVYPRLHTLDIIGVRGETLVAQILDSFCLPSLKNWVHSQSDFPLDSMISFAGCLSSCFEIFKISVDEVDYHQLGQLCCHLSSIQLLVLRVIYRDTKPLISWLCSSAESSLCLPHLQSLEFFCDHFSWASLPQIFAVPRWRSLRVQLNMKFDTVQDDLETAKLLVGLVDTGFNLSIIRDRKEDLLRKYREKIVSLVDA